MIRVGGTSETSAVRQILDRLVDLLNRDWAVLMYTFLFEYTQYSDKQIIWRTKIYVLKSVQGIFKYFNIVKMLGNPIE